MAVLLKATTHLIIATPRDIQLSEQQSEFNILNMLRFANGLLSFNFRQQACLPPHHQSDILGLIFEEPSPIFLGNRFYKTGRKTSIKYLINVVA